MRVFTQYRIQNVATPHKIFQPPAQRVCQGQTRPDDHGEERSFLLCNSHVIPMQLPEICAKSGLCCKSPWAGLRNCDVAQQAPYSGFPSSKPNLRSRYMWL